MPPLVSIVTPMYNDELYIASTINSVIKQTYKNWELILVDDASTDTTIKKVQTFVSKYPNIKLLKNPQNKGAAYSRNLATEEASGAYIAFLDADDQWRPNKLEKQVEVLNASMADVCFSSYDLIDSEGTPLNKKAKALKSLTYKKLLRANYIGNLTGIYNCEKLGKIYTKDLRKRQDWLLWLEALKRSPKPAIGLADSLADYRISAQSLSSNKLNLLKYNYNVYRKGLGFSYIKSIMYMVIFLFEHLVIKKQLVVSIT